VRLGWMCVGGSVQGDEFANVHLTCTQRVPNSPRGGSRHWNRGRRRMLVLRPRFCRSASRACVECARLSVCLSVCLLACQCVCLCVLGVYVCVCLHPGVLKRACLVCARVLYVHGWVLICVADAYIQCEYSMSSINFYFYTQFLISVFICIADS
jgi:hypothetical protein